MAKVTQVREGTANIVLGNPLTTDATKQEYPSRHCSVIVQRRVLLQYRIALRDTRYYLNAALAETASRNVGAQQGGGAGAPHTRIEQLIAAMPSEK